jgi:hypothetical protein
MKRILHKGQTKNETSDALLFGKYILLRKGKKSYAVLRAV